MVAAMAEVVVAGPEIRAPRRLSWVGSWGGGGAVLSLRMYDIPPPEALSHRQTILQLCPPHPPATDILGISSLVCAIFHYCAFQKRPLPESAWEGQFLSHRI